MQNPVLIASLAVAIIGLRAGAPPEPTSALRRTLVVGSHGAVTVLSGNTLWPAGSSVVLAGPLRIPAGSRLAIGAGAHIEASAGSNIVIERTAWIDVQGTAIEPVVFTCAEATPGCWEGITILGNAPINHGTATSPSGGRGGAGGCLESVVGGVPFGGCTSDDSSGVVRYIRMQYASYGLRVYGVGSRTALKHIQVHRSAGYGLDVTGGTVNFRYLVLTTNAQYGLLYRGGWTGRAQYVIVQQDPSGYAGGVLGRNAFAAGGDQNASPRSAPVLANVTVVAPPSSVGNPYAGASPAALRFELGAAGRLYNVLLVSPSIAVDVDDPATCSLVGFNQLSMQGVGVTSPGALADSDTDPAECATGGEGALLAGATVVSGAAGLSQIVGALDVVLPDLRPVGGSIISQVAGAVPPSADLLDPAYYLGALQPAFGAVIPWYSGWTIGEALAPPTLVAITGSVTTASSVGIAGVVVRVTPAGAVTTSDAIGHFSFAGVPAGPIDVTVTGGVPSDCLVPPAVPALAVASATTTVGIVMTCGLPAAAPEQRSLWAGNYHTCALTNLGTSYCWGWNADGELGDGTTTDRPFPTLVAGGLAFTVVAARAERACGLTFSSILYCWGANDVGQVGDGTTTNRSVPTIVAGGQHYTFMAPSGSHTCALTSGGAAYCWGLNNSGQLGDGTLTQRLVPTAVTGGLAFSMLAMGGSHTCGLSAAGQAYCWGSNGFGQLGDGTLVSRRVPAPVAGGLVFVTLVARGSQTCGLVAGGAANCWGTNGSGQLGDGTLEGRLVPTPVTGGLVFTALSMGSLHTCGLAAGGSAYCWGANDSGQLGDGSTNQQLTPTAVAGGLSFTTIGAGRGHTCGLTSSGAAYCWGLNDRGQLGDGTSTPHLIPAAASGALIFRTP